MSTFVKMMVLLACHVMVSAQNLPSEVVAALHRAKVPVSAVAMLVTDVDARVPPRLSHRAEVPMNAASVIKLVTTCAALDILGPAYTWRTPVWIDGPVMGGVLKGNVVIQGQGDPKLVLEKLWLLLRRVQGFGIETIAGDIVLDSSLFDVPAKDPASFDGEPLRPYNAAPDALLINFKSLVMTLVPDPQARVAHVQFDPPLWGVQMQSQVRLSVGKNTTSSNECDDYRTHLKADFSDPARIRFDGSYPANCAEKVWPVAYADPGSFNARAVEGLWRSMGGKLTGSARQGTAPQRSATFEVTSPSLTEVIRDINKFSNNVMAQQVFLTLGYSVTGKGSREAARDVLHEWWLKRIGASDAPLLDNGSGLSRTERISAQSLGRLLLTAYASPWMPELMSSLPIVGVDGTLKRSQATAVSAHIKTGSLRDVMSVAGYVDAVNGRRYGVVAIVNHPNASAAREALDNLLVWTAKAP